jgi:hypothetical protein
MIPDWPPVCSTFHAMIEELFPTKSLYATLAVFFDYPDDPLHPRLIARVTGVDIKCVRRQLPRLVKSGVIVSRNAGKERRYRLRREFPLFGELAAIFAKTRNTRTYCGQTPFPDPLGFLEDLMDDGE